MVGAFGILEYTVNSYEGQVTEDGMSFNTAVSTLSCYCYVAKQIGKPLRLIYDEQEWTCGEVLAQPDGTYVDLCYSLHVARLPTSLRMIL